MIENTLRINNPATGIKITRVQKDDAESVQQKYQLLKNGQAEWANTPLSERLWCIEQFFRLLDVERVDLAETLTAEMGKPFQEALNEIQGARGRIHFFLNNTSNWLQDEWMIPDAPTRERLSFEPLGVIGNISAWNYPYLVGVNVFIPALLTGNTVLYKPSEYATLTGAKIRDLLYEAGIPLSAFQMVTGNAEQGEMMLDLPLDAYFFTGSYKTGMYIYQKVAPKLVPVQLELGGKDPLYVTNDADIHNAALSAAEGAFYNNGQSCCAVERIYVHQDVYDQFVELFVAEVNANWQPNLPALLTTKLGAISRKEHLAFLDEQVKDALDQGATLLTGGKRADRKGWFYEPTVLTNVNHSMSIMRDETFGPLIGIQKVANDTEAITLMNDTQYGLTAAVYTNNEDRAEQIMKQLNAGTVYLNCCDRVSPNLPWSGRQHSGLGATLSYMGIRAFVRPKAYHLRHV